MTQILSFEIRIFILCHCILEGYELNFLLRDLTVKTLWTFKGLEVLKSVGTFEVGLEMLRTGARSLQLSLGYGSLHWTLVPLTVINLKFPSPRSHTLHSSSLWVGTHEPLPILH